MVLRRLSCCRPGGAGPTGRGAHAVGDYVQHRTIVPLVRGCRASWMPWERRSGAAWRVRQRARGRCWLSCQESPCPCAGAAVHTSPRRQALGDSDRETESSRDMTDLLRHGTARSPGRLWCAMIQEPSRAEETRNSGQSGICRDDSLAEIVRPRAASTTMSRVCGQQSR